MDLLMDVGSSNIKWKIYEEGKGTGEGSIPFPAPLRDEYPYFEVDGEESIGCVQKIIRLFSPSRTFFSVQMHGYILLKNGKPVTPYISWRDKRGEGITPHFSITQEYGVSLKPNLPRLSLQTLHTDADSFCTLGSFLSYCLTGRNETHITDAAASGFFNVKLKSIDECRLYLPEASFYVKEIGRYASSRIYTPTGDQQASVLGAVSACSEHGNGYVMNLGTAGQLCMISEKFIRGDFESRPYFYGKTLCTVTGLPAGEFLKRQKNADRTQTEEIMYQKYFSALQKLPRRKSILAVGGVTKYHRDLVERVLNRLGLDYFVDEKSGAIEGLKILAGEAEKR